MFDRVSCRKFLAAAGATVATALPLELPPGEGMIRRAGALRDTAHLFEGSA